MSRMVMTPLDHKMSELDYLKRDIMRHLADVNTLKLDYIQWWEKKRSRFLESLHRVQLCHQTLVPQQITSMTTYKKLISMAHVFERTSALSPRYSENCTELLEEFLTFWNRLLDLKIDSHNRVYLAVSNYCATITTLRQPEIKERIDVLYKEVDTKTEDDYNFADIHDSRENLFAYRISLADVQVLGFIGYIPHIITLLQKLCHTATKLHVEKE